MHHAAAEHRYFSIVILCLIDDLLYTVHIGGECSDNDPLSLRPLEQLFKAAANSAFRACKAGTLCIGGVAHQCQYTLFTDLGKTLQIDRITKYRCIIHIKVTCMDNNSCR